MDFVNENYLIGDFAELVLGIDKNKPLVGGHLRADFKETASIALHHLVVLGAHDTLGDDFLAGNVLVVASIGLGGGSDDGFGEFLILAHALGKLHAADFAHSGGIFTPCAAGEVAAYDHFHTESLGFLADGDHRVGSSELPIGNLGGGCIEEVCGNLVEHLALEGYALGEHDVKCRYTVGSHHYEESVVDVVDIAHLAMIEALLAGKFKIGRSECGLHNDWRFVIGSF